MSLLLEVNGIPYKDFTSGSVTARLDALCNTFIFTTVSTQGLPLPFRGGESCRVIVDDEVVLSGHVEIISVDYSEASHQITITGRDYTGDLLDSTLDAISDIRAPITLKEIIRKVLSSINLDLDVIEKTSTKAFNAAEDLISPKPGSNAFSLIEQYARKRNVLITSNGDGNIVITKSSGEVINASIRGELNSDDNNVLTASASYDTTGRYNAYKFTSSLNPIALNLSGAFDLAAVVNQSGGTNDTEVRKSRQLVLIAESPFSNGQNEERAKWEANVRKARGQVYSAQVLGYKNVTGNLWKINTLVNVKDDFCGINAQMLINSVTYNLNLDGGSTTTLTLLDKDSYTLALAKPIKTKSTRGLGLGLT